MAFLLKLFKASMFLVAFCCLSVLSSVFYSVFYNLVIPSSLVTYNVHFEEVSNLKATVPLDASVLGKEIPYTVELEWSFPTSETNAQIGNLKVDLAVTDNRGFNETTSKVVVLPYTSSYLKKLKVLALAPLYITNILREKDSARVTLFQSKILRPAYYGHVVNDYGSSKQVTATLQVDSSKLEIYEAKLHFVPQINDVRSFMYKHRIISFFFLSSVFWLTSSGSMLVIYAVAYSRFRQTSMKKSV
ncbi:siepin [Schizosaccharomyces japonicus yFS275]|uniref:Siepin n=1 Tax=Schizosaccharomyces japonicus (strain yFS275 / FY16936) TaxID=402676 RepID=B6JY78_SCHJY|nr:siepin [Schizosaccharomyces japonicus yFS275]EEB06496.2 siepin [Schizosaccharomyces japonicus yFS275]